MRVLLQRVTRAAVSVDGAVTGRIGTGFLALIGIGRDDGEDDVHRLAAKTARLRVFDDAAGLMNRALADVDGAVLAVPQFTLYADARKGNRPSFSAAAPPEQGERLYTLFVDALRAEGIEVQTGVFGAEMRVELVNDGPVTILLES